MIWALLIAFVVHLLAYFLYRVGLKVLETEKIFKTSIGLFLLVFVVGAIGMKMLIPEPGPANISAIPKAWMDPVFASR